MFRELSLVWDHDSEVLVIEDNSNEESNRKDQPEKDTHAKSDKYTHMIIDVWCSEPVGRCNPGQDDYCNCQAHQVHPKDNSYNFHPMEYEKYNK